MIPQNFKMALGDGDRMFHQNLPKTSDMCSRLTHISHRRCLAKGINPVILVPMLIKYDHKTETVWEFSLWAHYMIEDIGVMVFSMTNSQSITRAICELPRYDDYIFEELLSMLLLGKDIADLAFYLHTPLKEVKEMLHQRSPDTVVWSEFTFRKNQLGYY